MPSHFCTYLNFGKENIFKKRKGQSFYGPGAAKAKLSLLCSFCVLLCASLLFPCHADNFQCIFKIALFKQNNEAAICAALEVKKSSGSYEGYHCTVSRSEKCVAVNRMLSRLSISPVSDTVLQGRSL